jgi:hypothetical protein
MLPGSGFQFNGRNFFRLREVNTQGHIASNWLTRGSIFLRRSECPGFATYHSGVTSFLSQNVEGNIGGRWGPYLSTQISLKTCCFLADGDCCVMLWV